MEINTVIIIIEKMQQNLRYFNLNFSLNSITPCDITVYCIVGLKTIFSYITFFLFQLICILAKMVVTSEPARTYSCGFRSCTQENKFCHSNHVFYSQWGLFKGSADHRYAFKNMACKLCDAYA